MGEFSFTLQLGGSALEISGELPEPGAPSSEMVPVYLGIGELLLETSSRESEREGAVPSCGPGCGACCRQLVPISLSEAAYLRAVVVPNLAEDHRRRVEERMALVGEKLAEAGMLRELEGLPAETDRVKRQSLGLRYFLLGIPCPFLEQESCSIHPQRPLACREYLVTSPAARCAKPDAGGIVPLVPKVKPSQALILTDRSKSGSGGWITMITALISKEPPVDRPVEDPQQELGSFLSNLGKV